jgi:hypothetical protein
MNTSASLYWNTPCRTGLQYEYNVLKMLVLVPLFGPFRSSTSDEEDLLRLMTYQ